MTAPFTDATFPEVCARVTYRLIERKYRQTRQERPGGPIVAGMVLADLEPLKGSLIYSCTLAACCALIARKRLADWRDTAVSSSRLGYGFRRCWYDDYKANRRG